MLATLLPAANPDTVAAALRQSRLRRLADAARIANASDLPASSAGVAVTSLGQSGSTSGLSQTCTVVANPGLFTVHGGVPVLTANTYWRIASVSRASGGNVNATRDATVGRIAFRTDAASIDVRVSNTLAVPCRIAVDGVFLDRAGQTNTADAGNIGTTAVTTFNLAFASRKLRRIDVEIERNGAFAGVRVAPGDTIQPVATAERYRVGVIGDSVSAGTGAANYFNGYVYHAGRRLGGGDLDLVSMSIGGTGYTTAGNGTGALKFGDRLDDLLQFGPGGIDEVWFVGSSNDQGQPAAAITAAALACFQGARAKLPQAPVIVFGTFVGGSGTGAATDVETAVKAAFDLWADPNSAFVPFRLAAMQLQTGTSASPTSGNYQWYLAGGDGTHPNDAGHDYIGSFVAEARRGLAL